MDNNEIMVNEKERKNMNETVKNWLINLYEKEIDESKTAISNECIWELGYNGEEPNPHTNNIRDIQEYINVLEEKIRELQTL